MNKIDKMFRDGEINHWLYRKIDSLFEENHPTVHNILRLRLLYYFCLTGLFTVILLLIMSCIYGEDYLNKNIKLLFGYTGLGICSGILMSFVIDFFLLRFYTKHFMYYYTKLYSIFEDNGVWFKNFIRTIEYSYKLAVGQFDGPIFTALSNQFINILRIESDLGNKAYEYASWTLERQSFQDCYDLFLIFDLIDDPEKGWSPYRRKAMVEFEGLSRSEEENFLPQMPVS